MLLSSSLDSTLFETIRSFRQIASDFSASSEFLWTRSLSTRKVKSSGATFSTNKVVLGRRLETQRSRASAHATGVSPLKRVVASEDCEEGPVSTANVSEAELELQLPKKTGSLARVPSESEKISLRKASACGS